MKISPIQLTTNKNNNKNFKGWVQFNNALINTSSIESIQISKRNNTAFMVTTSGSYINTDATYYNVVDSFKEAIKSYSKVVKCKANIVNSGTIKRHILIDNEYLKTKDYDPSNDYINSFDRDGIYEHD